MILIYNGRYLELIRKSETISSDIHHLVSRKEWNPFRQLNSHQSITIQPSQACKTECRKFRIRASAHQSILSKPLVRCERLQRINLTAVTDRSAVLERHVGDSLALLPVIDHGIEAASNLAMNALCKESLRVVDVGSGAGLPGLILAIARPG